ncbi:recombination protein O N-terminal domain-containing protein [Qipengyuania sp. XHP0211]|uniref:DNA repair protein RecO n=1 Tax=Qipengyuania sp. XHP0211 TaxID=3038079 RepID=UPI00241BFFC8|nr:recombination protein O N-terminal domain-containing protein [Qipengyuania sp. XHP0211]MDG5750836.1 recombination protein O N-terminal domain-containing protein [Qipengyuania sp. XHP0211]
MHLTAPAILLAARPHGETAVIARMLTEQSGVVAAYVAGGRGRLLRPVVIPGNIVQAEIRAKSDNQLPFARIELMTSRGPWLSEPLPAAAIAWITALTAAVLPERNAYPTLYTALGALLDAICSSDAARQWVEALAVYEALLLRELGYGGQRPAIADLGQALEILDRQEPLIARYLLADTRADVLAARQLLRQRLARMVE